MPNHNGGGTEILSYSYFICIVYLDTYSYVYYAHYMTITITMTSKGQFTLPAHVRKAMALREQGDKLLLEFSATTHQAVLTKPTSFTDIQKKATAYIKPGTPPLADVGTLYETREARL